MTSESTPQTLTAVHWKDRHTSGTIHLFTNRDVAEAWARKTARDRAWTEADYRESTYGGTVFIKYSEEGDYLMVRDAVVDADA